ncbi:MAG: hypothetical protein ABFR33_10290 [Verrucomicrobiota bacterium]
MLNNTALDIPLGSFVFLDGRFMLRVFVEGFWIWFKESSDANSQVCLLAFSASFTRGAAGQSETGCFGGIHFVNGFLCSSLETKWREQGL